ncbi:MAG TPA: hypothetical protein PLS53_00750 [Thermoanaerobaculaceae bacterium]|nr:hypothetical protein [Thermoanaerobaculaceae bacterium]HPS76662.1 hypothetical protein [Thermoanaerobaculaceae bacterium]
MRRRRASIAGAVLILVTGRFAAAQTPTPPDPSGVWRSSIGELSLLLAGDALSFSYSAVFGATAHICDGAGVAGLVTGNRYEHVDEQGTIAILLRDGEVRLETVTGVPSFCGANWPGDTLVREGSPTLRSCRVKVARSRFHIVGTIPPEPRKGYVVSGDRVEVVPLQDQGNEGWVLGRFRGARGATVGLLRASDLDCAPAPPTR